MIIKSYTGDEGVGYFEKVQDAKSPTPGGLVVMLELIRDLWVFLKQRKKLWLAPIIMILLILGMLIVLTQGSAIAPFIYSLF